MQEQEFECKICGFCESESSISRSLEEAFPSLKWEEGDSAWDKIRVIGKSRNGNLAGIFVYRYEGPGAFRLTIRLRIPDGADGEQEYLAVRQKVLQALGGRLWQPLEPQPMSPIKPNGRFPDAYEFESDLGIGDIKKILDDAEFWDWHYIFINRLSSETCLASETYLASGYRRNIRIIGSRQKFRIEVGNWQDAPNCHQNSDQVHETVQNTILPAIGARNIRAAEIPATAAVTISDLIRILKTGPGWQQRSGAAEALGEIGADGRTATPALIEALRDENHYVRSHAAQALGSMGPAALEAVPALLKALWDKDADVPKCVMEALRRIGTTQAAIPKLILMLKTAKSPRRRRTAVESLGKIGSSARAAIPALMDALRDEDNGVRLDAARALGLMGSDARVAIAALQEAAVAGGLQLQGTVRTAIELIREGNPGA
jgi:hypothetical protein